MNVVVVVGFGSVSGDSDTGGYGGNGGGFFFLLC